MVVHTRPVTPFLSFTPLTTSWNDWLPPLRQSVADGLASDAALPASAYIAAIIGDASLVPPWPVAKGAYEDPWLQGEHAMTTPVYGSAFAETSVAERILQPLSVCHAGLGTIWLQPLPVAHGAPPPHWCIVSPSQTTSPPYVPFFIVSDVPPTQTTP